MGYLCFQNNCNEMPSSFIEKKISLICWTPAICLRFKSRQKLVSCAISCFFLCNILLISHLKYWQIIIIAPVYSLTLKMLITKAADIFLVFYFSEKIRLDIACESYVEQTIHMKASLIFCLKDKNNNDKKNFFCLLQLCMEGSRLVSI